MDLDRLRTLPVFASLSEDELRRVAPLAVQCTAAEGTQPGDYFTPGAAVVATSPVRLVALDIDAARRLALT